MSTKFSKALSAVLTVMLIMGISGCCEEHHSEGGKAIRLSPIFGSMVTGAIIGGIIGNQSDERDNGIAVGAAVFGVGALLSEIDRVNRNAECENKDDDKGGDEVVFQIQNDNGSQTEVILKKRGGKYIGPKGEKYDHLPTAEQLKRKYGS